MKRTVLIPVSTNGRRGNCRKCGGENVALADASFPNGKVVHSINCQECILEDGILQGRLMASIGFAYWPGFDVLAKYEFVRA